MHRSRASAPTWFESEGFQPAVDPDAARVTIHSIELPTETRPSGRVVCALPHLPEVRVAVHLSTETGEMVGLELGDPAVLLRQASGVPKPISARMLREIPFGEIERAARESLRWELAVRVHHGAPEVRAMVGDGGRILRESLAAAQRPGRRGRQDRAYASLAAEYVRRLSSPTPVKDLAEAMGYSPSRIRNMLAEARRRRLLTRPPSGKSGGQLTEKALALLQEEDD